MTTWLASALVVGVLTGVLLAAGQEPSTPVVFEVAAVRPNTSGQIAAQIEETPGGRYTAINASLRILILRAYEIPDNQLIGAPDWTRNERFDVNATLGQEPPAVPRGQPGARRLALRSLLAERFKLVVHPETRQFPMYALVMARADRTPGPMLRPSSIDCSPKAMEARGAAAQAGKPLSGACGSLASSGRIQFGGRSLSDFARGLSGAPDVGRNVIDRTGPSLFTALQEQLGLKLESIQGPMEVLVVDRVERLDAQDAIDPRP